MDKKNCTELKGTVDSISYMNPDNGFAVILLEAEGEPVTAVGEIGEVDEGEMLHLIGEFTNHPRYGEQFKVSLCHSTLPTNVTAIQKYLASGVIKGIGPVLAKSIVNRFGDEVFDIFENSPLRLTEIDGISKKKALKFAEDFAAKFPVRRLMSYLADNGIPSSVGIRAYRAWGSAALDMIKSNPYCLCSSEVGFSFARADEFAAKLEFAADCDSRINAGIKNELSKSSSEGHTCLPTDMLRERTCQALNVSHERFDEMLEHLHSERIVVTYTKSDGLSYEMLHDYAVADVNISRRLNIMSQLAYDSRIDYSDVIDIAQEQNDIIYEDIQRKAINTALSTGFLVLTGGPGTGKTTTLNAIISLFQQQGMNVRLAAPTGRAAKRMTELTGVEAKTIHRLLEVQFADGDKPHFLHDENNTLECEVLIVDEMSMVDTLLFDALLRALPITSKLVLVGDSDQLPSVGAGNLLRDIIDSGVVPTITLREVFRQASTSRIVTNAHRIISGEEIIRGDCEDFYVFPRKTYNDLRTLIVDLCKDRLPGTYGIDPLENIQVISPTRQGPCGTVELNRVLQEKLNPPSKSKQEIRTLSYTFRVGDKVMQNRNNYDIIWKKVIMGETESGAGIFNGDIGVITKINKMLGLVTISFDGRVCEYNTAMLDNLELAYAITVHKSQGSEYDYVIFSAFPGYEKLLYRNLLYTAVTRAKTMFIIAGSMEVISFMISNNRRSERYSCLKDILTEDNGDEMDI